ncbi:MAG: hypothetical protein LBI92_09225 [Azoarcus sp.]|jgi:hypothetical protein|nr:hypothetical protein [Azoarcus sp.]
MQTHAKNSHHFPLILLAVANILALIAAFGLGLGQPDKKLAEPDRVVNQIRPEDIEILGQTPTPGLVSAALARAPDGEPVCLAWSGLGEIQDKRLLALFAAADITAKERNASVAAAWAVRTTRAVPTREAADILADTMLYLGIERSRLKSEEIGSKKFVIVLNELESRQEAAAFFDAIKARGLQDVEIAPRMALEHRIEATLALARAEALLAGQSFAKRHKPCEE